MSEKYYYIIEINIYNKEEKPYFLRKFEEEHIRPRHRCSRPIVRFCIKTSTNETICISFEKWGEANVLRNRLINDGHFCWVRRRDKVKMKKKRLKKFSRFDIMDLE